MSYLVHEDLQVDKRVTLIVRRKNTFVIFRETYPTLNLTNNEILKIRYKLFNASICNDNIYIS